MEFLMQPVRRTAVMVEVNDNELPMEPLQCPAVAIGADELPPMATGSVDGQICEADVAAAAEGDDEPQASEQSIGQIYPKTPGWTHGPHFCNFGYLMGLLKNCMVEMQPYAEMRDGLGLEDRMAQNGDVVHQLLAAGAVVVVMDKGDIGNQGEDALSANGSANRLEGLLAPRKRKEIGRPTTIREKALYEGLRRTRLCTIYRQQGHKRTTCPDRGDVSTPVRRLGRCCGVEGHRRNNCCKVGDLRLNNI